MNSCDECTLPIATLKDVVREEIRPVLELLEQQKKVALLTAEEAAKALGVKIQTLAAWRTKGEGPAYVRVGNSIRYEAKALEEYVAHRRVGGLR